MGNFGFTFGETNQGRQHGSKSLCWWSWERWSGGLKFAFRRKLFYLAQPGLCTGVKKHNFLKWAHCVSRPVHLRRFHFSSMVHWWFCPLYLGEASRNFCNCPPRWKAGVHGRMWSGEIYLRLQVGEWCGLTNSGVIFSVIRWGGELIKSRLDWCQLCWRICGKQWL